MMEFDEQQVWANVRQADTEDLLDRATFFRRGMEEDALPIIEAELRRRGFGPDKVAEHERNYGSGVLFGADGIAHKCSFCRRPAVLRAWRWHRLWKRLPLFPRSFFFCREHKPE